MEVIDTGCKSLGKPARPVANLAMTKAANSVAFTGCCVESLPGYYHGVRF